MLCLLDEPLFELVPKRKKCCKPLTWRKEEGPLRSDPACLTVRNNRGGGRGEEGNCLEEEDDEWWWEEERDESGFLAQERERRGWKHTYIVYKVKKDASKYGKEGMLYYAKKGVFEEGGEKLECLYAPPKMVPFLALDGWSLECVTNSCPIGEEE